MHMGIETIAIIGAGELGQKFAYLSLRAGYRTILEDVSLTAVERAVSAIREMLAANATPLGNSEKLASGAARRRGSETIATDSLPAGSSKTVAPDGPQVAASGTLGDLATKLVTAHSVEQAVREADLIIEAVADELEMKLELFTIFDKFAKPAAIFASTTDSIRISDLADMTFCPECCIGMRLAHETDGRQAIIAHGETRQPRDHPDASEQRANNFEFSERPKNELTASESRAASLGNPARLELVKSRNTSPQTLDCCIEVAQRMHLIVEVIRDESTFTATANGTNL
jgi:3-hydroxyacyl-CoA dehydrogenase